jgi:hypothetical protein
MTPLSRRASGHLIVLSLVIGGMAMVAITLSLSADLLGLGDGSGFGSRQAAIIVQGALALVFALLLYVYGMGQRHPVLRPFSRAVRAPMMVLLVCVTIEAVAQATGIIMPYISSSVHSVPHRIKDHRLGARFPEGSDGHDALGFRNRDVLAAPEIVAIGDSMTWGVNVSMDAAWPSVLGKATSVPVYNMSVPGYGPVQYELLAQQSYDLSPRILVIALYLGNDLWNAYEMAYSLDGHIRWRAPQSQWGPAQWAATRGELVALPPGGLPLALQGALTESALITAMRLVRYRLRAVGAARPTVFTYRKRRAGVDLGREEVAEGSRLTKVILDEIAIRTKALGIHLLLLTIPTKESAYADAIPAGAADHETLVAMEREVAEDIEAFCRTRAITYVHSLPALRKAVAAGKPVYPLTANGHPAASGYSIIADVVRRALRDCDWLPDQG